MAVSSFSSLLERVFSTFGRSLPQIALVIGDKVARLIVQSMIGLYRMPTFETSFVATVFRQLSTAPSHK